MKGILERINKNSYLVFILTLFKIWDIIKPLFSSYKPEGYLKNYYANYDWLGFSVYILTVLILFFVLRMYIKLKKEFNETTEQFRDEMDVFTIIMHARAKQLFVLHYDNVEYYRVPNESDEEYLARLPQYGLFQKHLRKEFNIVRNAMLSTYKDRTPNELDSLLSKYYPKDFFKN